MNFKNNLDIIFEDTEIGSYGPIDELIRQLQDARQQVSDIEHKLATVKHNMSVDLALNIRKTQPSLNIALDKQGCKVGYKTKLFHITPDLENGIWKITSSNSRFLREFLNVHRRTTLINNDLSIFANAIVTYFNNYYRTLGEDLNGTGIILIEEKKSTLLQLVGLKSTSERPMLKSRLVRKMGG